MRSPLFAVAGLAVNILVRTVARDDRVQSLGAVFALEALAMPCRAFSEHLFSCKYYATATWTTLAGKCHNTGSINDCSFWSSITVGIAVTLQSTTALAIAVTLWTEFLAVTNSAIYVLVWTVAM